MHSAPLEVVQVVVMETFDTHTFVLRSTPGSTGYKRHAAWYITLADISSGDSPEEIWRQGQLHVVLSASAVGHTRLSLSPAIQKPAGTIGVLIIGPYIGDHEATLVCSR